MLINLALLIGGLLALIWSADRFVYGASAFARNMGLPPLLIGLTIVAMGSSAPEMFVAATAALDGRPDTAVGNVLGSNIANITLILGVTASIRVIAVDSSTLIREIPLMLAASLLAGWCIYDGYLEYTEAVILLAAFLAVMGYLIWHALDQRGRRPDKLARETDDDIPADVTTGSALGWLAVGLVLLPLSSDWLVEGAVGIAQYFGMSDLMIGLTIIAIGTSLPELAASIASLMKNEHDLAVGNVVGSNLFNILAVLAIPGFIAPNVLDANASGRDLYIMLATSGLLALLLVLGGKPRQLKRWHGWLFLAIFIGYQVTLFVSR
ncbi:calcium/sodium antiporter [Paraferrimonas sedimenticola]|uniref:Sodium:calcium antiporter n=1 Tax=Paraferrimonas sedimenticola TaxID=375674 RepID=A0AA37RU55_9GAMM|nr:calcium/sodium antiporter [Paraferrimonas sedimenticola]GLP95825.1 sodium:calcium antiporter [Paraferrimonas sedimenticola]